MAMTQADLTSLAPAQCGFHDLAFKAVLKDEIFWVILGHCPFLAQETLFFGHVLAVPTLQHVIPWAMKFGKQLERHKVRGWDAFYVDYNGLKKSLKAYFKVPSLSASVSTFERDISSSDGAASPRVAQVKVSPEWVAELQLSIDRTNEFFTSVADEVESRLMAGQDELKQNEGSDFEHQLRRHLQSMIGQLQGTLQDLSHFAAANHTALYKILKKHDKQTGLALSKQLLPQILREAFNEPGKVRIDSLQGRLQRFADELGLDNSPWALDRGDDILTQMTQVARISFFLGVISMALVVLAVLSGMEPQIDQFSVEDLADTGLIQFRLVWFGLSCFILSGSTV